MEVNRLLLKPNKPEVVEEDIDFSSNFIDANHVKRINSCHVKATLTDYEDVLECTLNIKADVTASCAYTLEDVPYKVNVNEKLYFSSDEMDQNSEDIIYEPGNEIEMDHYVFSLIIASVPHNIHKKGAKLPENGNGFRVMSEEDYLKEKASKKKNSPFDALDDLDL